MKLPDLSCAEGLDVLDAHLLDKSYVEGPEPTQADVKVWKAVREADIGEQRNNLRRWFTNIQSFGADEQKAFEAARLQIELAAQERPAKEVLEDRPRLICLFSVLLPARTCASLCHVTRSIVHTRFVTAFAKLVSRPDHVCRM